MSNKNISRWQGGGGLRDCTKKYQIILMINLLWKNVYILSKLTREIFQNIDDLNKNSLFNTMLHPRLIYNNVLIYDLSKMYILHIIKLNK